MNKLKMAAVQERLKLKRVQIDTWTTREKLCLASAVLRSGDQNWVSVSRTLRGFDELNRPPDWFSQKNCALQYSSLLEKVDTPKRKRGERGEVHVETPGENIVRKLTSERVEELKKSIEYKKALHQKLRQEIALVQSGQADDKLDEMLQEIEEEKVQKKKEAELHAQWLKEREEKLLEIKRAWRPPAASSSSAALSTHHKQRESDGGTRRSSSQSDQSSEAESLEDSPLSEPLQVDVIGDESLEAQGDAKPSSPLRESSPQPTPSLLPCTTSAPATPTPTSPLLTSLLKSPSQAPSLQASSILHSAITAQRGSSPTITSLLNSSPGIPVSSAVSPSVSAGIKNLVTSAISGDHPNDHPEKTQQPVNTTPSPSAGAPTLSMLLELPPSQPGKPLPEIPSIPPKLPSTPTKESGALSPPHSSPPSPQPAQGPELSQLASEPKVEEGRSDECKVEEGMSEETAAEPEKESTVSEEKEETVEEIAKSEVVESEDPKSEKPEAEVSDSNAEPEVLPMVEDVKDVPSSDLITQVNESFKELEPAVETPVSEITEESVTDGETTSKAVEKEPNNDTIKALSSVPPPGESLDHVEVIAEINSEALVEVIKDDKSVVSPAPDIEVITPGTDEITIRKEPGEEIASLPAEKLLTDVEVHAENPKKILDSQKEAETPEGEPLSEAEIKSTSEMENKVVEQEKPLSPAPTDGKVVVTEVSIPENNESDLKKEESIADLVVEEDNLESRSPLEENILSTPEIPISDAHVKRKGGHRGRKSRGRALPLQRYRQERLAREKLEKVRGYTVESEGDADIVTKEQELPDVSLPAEDDVLKEKTEVKKVSEEEVSNLKSEWDEDTVENAMDDEKKLSSTSQKKGKLKKAEESGSAESEPNLPTSPNAKKTSQEDNLPKESGEIKEKAENKGEETEMTDKETIDHSAKKKDEKPKEEEKPLVSVEVESKAVEKVSEKKKKEEPLLTEPSEPKKISVERRSEERRSEERRTPEKKADSKVKQVPVEKKVEERKKLKETRMVERKERRGEEERRVEREDPTSREAVSKAGKDEEKRSVGKERRSDGKERRSMSEKRGDVGERKPSRERRVEGNEKAESEKVSGDRGSKDKGDDKESRKGDGEKKVWRERKSEDKEKKVVSEKKEENKKVSDEKKVEDTESSKLLRKETVTPTKKILAVNTPEKSKTPLSKTHSIPAGGEKLKRKIELLEEDDSSLDDSLQPPDAKHAKMSEETIREEPVEPDKVDSDRKSVEEVSVKRKVDRRKGTQNKRVDPDEAVSRSSSLQMEEKSNDGEATPKQSQGRRKASASVPISSAPATPLDQIPHSPASLGSISEEERDYRAWKKAILLVWSRLATHKFASIFLRPITNDQAPGYHNVVYRPVDLHTIKKNVENGVIRTTAHFQRDVMLMFLNAIMYNSSDHDVHRMSLQMQQESLQHIQILLEASEAPKILRRETREGNKRSDSSSMVQSASNPSQDETLAGVSSSAIATAPTPAENVHINLSEEEMSECDYPLSYSLSTAKGNLSGNLSRDAEPENLLEHSQKDYSCDNFRKKKCEPEENSHQLLNNDCLKERHSSGENSNGEVSDMEDDKAEVIGRPRLLSKRAQLMRKKERKQSSMSSSHLAQDLDADLGDEQLSSSQFGDNDLCANEMDKKQERGLKQPLNECSSSSEDSCSIPDDSGDWSNVMSMRGEKGDDSESVSSIFNKRRRVQRKSTNSDPESLLDAPTFPFSSNFASLEENDYQAWKKFVLMVWDQLADHEFATIFMTPVRTDEAPRYYNVVFRPMDLGTIRKNVEKGVVRTISHFQRDVMLMLNNAIMYNPSHHDVHRKTAQMQNECVQFLQMLVAESSEDPEVFRHEIRESNNKVRSTGIEELAASFPPESPSIEEQLPNIPASGNWFSSSPVHSSLNGSVCASNEDTDVNVIGKNTNSGERTVKVFSKKRRISTLESV